MARRLGRPTSTVSREVNANGGRSEYRGIAAQRASTVRARRPKVRKLVANVALAAVVADGLAKRWSPAEVAARPEFDSLRGVGEGRDAVTWWFFVRSTGLVAECRDNTSTTCWP